MSKRKYVYADSYGVIYRFSPRKWKQMLRLVASGNEVYYSRHGEMIAVIDHNITDLSQAHAQELLEDFCRKQEPLCESQATDSKG